MFGFGELCPQAADSEEPRASVVLKALEAVLADKTLDKDSATACRADSAKADSGPECNKPGSAEQGSVAAVAKGATEAIKACTAVICKMACKLRAKAKAKDKVKAATASKLATVVARPAMEAATKTDTVNSPVQSVQYDFTISVTSL
ncbi:unnamed protein product [Spodoptera exigua]|nr:unnamed protein product [Spodoptera exigua]